MTKLLRRAAQHLRALIAQLLLHVGGKQRFGQRAMQCGDGSWNAEGVYEAKPEATEESRLDVTSEFVALLSQMKAVSDV